jgi:hypothetical protein
MMGIVAETENFKTHIQVCTRDVEVDQVTSVDGSRTHGLAGLGFTVDTLDGRVNPQHLGNIALQNFSLVGGDEGLGNIGLVEEDVDRMGER